MLKVLQPNLNGCRIYVDIMTGKNCCQSRLLTWSSLISEVIHLAGGEGIG